MRRGFFSAVTVLALTLAAFPSAAVPPAAGGALASDNVDLIATVPDVAAIGGRFVGDTLYVTTTQGLRIYDTSLGIPVPLGALELPHFENEDVDTNGEILLISADSAAGFEPTNQLYVIDVSNKNLPVILSVLTNFSGAHTVSCINDCTYAWSAGANDIYIIDLRDPANPRQVSQRVREPHFTHDVQVDDAGVAWVVGSNGIFGYLTTPSAEHPTASPTTPVLLVSQGVTPAGPGPAFNSNFILHNSMRPNAAAMDPATLGDAVIDPGEVVLVTEEEYDPLSNNLCEDDGAFQTGWLHEVDGALTLDRIDSFNVGSAIDPTHQKPFGDSCSSHYFDYDDGIVADAWYNQGVRFLDVSNPRDIRQIGYYMPVVTDTWNAQFHNGLVYTFDVARGIDVLRFTGEIGAAEVRAPSAKPSAPVSRPSERWGYACRVLAA